MAGNNWRNQRMERAESVYGGTKSLYCKSPGVTRASLNRSQSVYSKPPSCSASVANGPTPAARMQSAQSTYLARNVDLIRTESIYASRPSPPMPAARYNPSPDFVERIPNVQKEIDSLIWFNWWLISLLIDWLIDWYIDWLIDCRADSVYGNSKPFRHPYETTDVSVHSPNNPRSPRSPREPIYGAACSDYSGHSGRSTKPECFQLEPVYTARPESSASPATTAATAAATTAAATAVTTTQRNDYVRKMTPTYRMGPPSALPPRPELETSNHSSAPISPSDTSKDSAYGSVHGANAHNPASEWTSAGTHHSAFNMVPFQQQQQLNQRQQQLQQQQQQQQHQQQHQPLYAQKFRGDLLSPASRHSPSAGSFHSPVQY